MFKEIFKYQIWHLIALVVLLYLFGLFYYSAPANSSGKFLNLTTPTWFWISIAVAIIHQIYVTLIWRLELYEDFFTKSFGEFKTFRVYAVGFLLLICCRLLFIIALAKSNRDTIIIYSSYTNLLTIIISPIVIYLLYSLFRYFTVERALGIDHFVKNYNEPFVKKGFFKFSNNAMYTYGILLFYLPGLLMRSKAALLAALFYHIYIWVHYFCTERPDLKKIYGGTP